jgi:hypothetical protein
MVRRRQRQSVVRYEDGQVKHLTGVPAGAGMSRYDLDGGLYAAVAGRNGIGAYALWRVLFLRRPVTLEGKARVNLAPGGLFPTPG